jgi:hypothetical protein
VPRGLDRDDFIDPGAAIKIHFERLGTFRCRFAEPASASRRRARVPPESN